MATDPTEKYKVQSPLLAGSLANNVNIPNVPNLDDLKSKAMDVKSKIGKIKDKFGRRTSEGGVDDSGKPPSILEIASVDWGCKYLYMIRIEGFYGVSQVFRDDIIPATNVQEKFPSVKTENIKLPMYGSFELPVNRGLPTLQVSMLDTVDCLVERLLRAWIYSINNGSSIGYLDDIVKKVYVHKLDYSRKLIYTNLYYAYPDGDILASMGSDNSLKELAVDFTVVDYEEDV